jgi:hypothetical protein
MRVEPCLQSCSLATRWQNLLQYFPGFNFLIEGRIFLSTNQTSDIVRRCHQTNCLLGELPPSLRFHEVYTCDGKTLGFTFPRHHRSASSRGRPCPCGLFHAVTAHGTRSPWSTVQGCASFGLLMPEMHLNIIYRFRLHFAENPQLFQTRLPCPSSILRRWIPQTFDRPTWPGGQPTAGSPTAQDSTENAGCQPYEPWTARPFTLISWYCTEQNDVGRNGTRWVFEGFLQSYANAVVICLVSRLPVRCSCFIAVPYTRQ